MQCSLEQSRLLILFLSYDLINVNLLTCSVFSDFVSIEIMPINSFQFEFEDSIDDNLKKTKKNF